MPPSSCEAPHVAPLRPLRLPALEGGRQLRWQLIATAVVDDTADGQGRRGDCQTASQPRSRIAGVRPSLDRLEQTMINNETA